MVVCIRYSHMKTLWIARHADAEIHRKDFTRPLSFQGREDARSVATAIMPFWTPGTRSFHSTALRTSETVQLWSSVLGPSFDSRPSDQLYLATGEDLMQFICSIPAAIHQACIVGHNPGISQFASRLTGQLIGLKPGDAALIQIELNDWGEVSSDFGNLQQIFTPSITP